MSNYNGFLNILKPPGMSSGQVVGYIRRLCDNQKIGHGGTLDPEAAGVLPIMVGRATRLSDYLINKEKKYIAEIAFGAATNTQDAQGIIIKKSDKMPSENQILSVLDRFRGEIWQTPPDFSAIQINGRRMYDLAREGQAISIPPRKIIIHSIELSHMMQDGAVLSIHCSKGTYIRTICDNIGEALSCPAHMRFLLRTMSGPFDINNAHTLEEVAIAKQNNDLEALLAPPDMPFAHMKSIDIPNKLIKASKTGGKMPGEYFEGLGDIIDNTPFRLYRDGGFLGIGEIKNNAVIIKALVGEQV